MADKYNGWTNYETWCVNLWLTNDEGSDSYWRETAEEIFADARDKEPNQFLNRRENAACGLAERLQAEMTDEDLHPVFGAANGTVFADLLNAALGEVNWHEIAMAFLEDCEDEDTDEEPVHATETE